MLLKNIQLTLTFGDEATGTIVRIVIDGFRIECRCDHTDLVRTIGERMTVQIVHTSQFAVGQSYITMATNEFNLFLL